MIKIEYFLVENGNTIGKTKSTDKTYFEGMIYDKVTGKWNDVPPAEVVFHGSPLSGSEAIQWMVDNAGLKEPPHRIPGES